MSSNNPDNKNTLQEYFANVPIKLWKHYFWMLSESLF